MYPNLPLIFTGARPSAKRPAYSYLGLITIFLFKDSYPQAPDSSMNGVISGVWLNKKAGKENKDISVTESTVKRKERQ
jgi:hypothetical protein